MASADPEKAVSLHEGSQAEGPSPAQAKQQPGQSWRQNEQHIIPKNRLSIVFAGLMCCIFLAALDQVSLGTSWHGCFAARSTSEADDCRHCTSYYRQQTRWWKRLQLGGKVRHHVVHCVRHCTDQVLPPSVPTCLLPLPFQRSMASYLILLVRYKPLLLPLHSSLMRHHARPEARSLYQHCHLLGQLLSIDPQLDCLLITMAISLVLHYVALLKVWYGSW